MIIIYISALKITFENLPIIKIKAVEKKFARHGWATRKIFQNENFKSVWTRLQKISVLSHAFHDFFKEVVMRGISHNFFQKKKTKSYKK